MTAFSANLFNLLLIDLINRLISCLNRVLDYINRLSNSIHQLIHALIQRIIGWGPGQGLGPRAATPTTHLSPWRQLQDPAKPLAIN